MTQARTSWWHSAKNVFLLTVVVLSFLLCGCGILRTDITFLQDERWKASVRMTIPAQALALYGGEEGIDSLLQQEAGEDWQQVQKVLKKERGKDGSVTYVFTTEGVGFDDLNEDVFAGQATITRDADGKISFSYFPGLEAQMYELSVTGGTIIRSNADEVKGSTAIWHDLMRSGSAEVVLTEPTGPDINLGLLGGGLLLVVLAVAVFLFFRSRTRRPVHVKSADSSAADYCMRCGAKVMPGAKFCPSCGTKIAPESPALDETRQ